MKPALQVYALDVAIVFEPVQAVSSSETLIQMQSHVFSRPDSASNMITAGKIV